MRMMRLGSWYFSFTGPGVSGGGGASAGDVTDDDLVAVSPAAVIHDGLGRGGG